MPRRGPEVDLAKRGAIVGLRNHWIPVPGSNPKRLRKIPLREISNIVNVPKSTCSDIIKKVKQNSFHNSRTRGEDALCKPTVQNCRPDPRPGREEILTTADIDRLVEFATRDEGQWVKKWSVIAAEAGVRGSRNTIARAMRGRGVRGVRFAARRK